MSLGDLLHPRLLIVTGKGGVGKSTAAAALALAAVRAGSRACLVEVEGRQTFSQMFDTAPWDFKEREFRPRLFGMSIDPEASLTEYLGMFYGAKRIAKLVSGNSAVEFATSAAPGIKDVLLIGKVKEMVQRRGADGRFTYDLIVADAPPTGRIVNFLRAPEATTELVPIGPIRQQAQSVIDLLRDGDRTHIQLVTLLEEMPVVETLESVAALGALGVTVGPVIVNRVTTARVDDDTAKALADLDAEAVARGLAAADLEVDAEGAADLLALGQGHLARLELEQRLREELAAQLDVPTLELPYVASKEFDTDAVTKLAKVVAAAVR